MENKKEKINFCLEKIKDIMKYLRNNDDIDFCYMKVENPEEHFSDWTMNYFGIRKNEEYIFVLQHDILLYSVNVTADSVLLAISELMNKLAEKF